jgi:DNA-binding NtrC family response regulator
VIAATNRDLEQDVRKGAFRSDLYYRLNVIELAVPSLRARPEDIPYLIAAFVRRYSATFGKAIKGLTPSAERMLTDAEWPGNVRQLRNVLERVCMLCEGHLITERDVAAALGARSPAPGEPAQAPAVPSPSQDAVTNALIAAQGNKALAARQLGVSRRALYRLLEKYDLEGT